MKWGKKLHSHLLIELSPLCTVLLSCTHSNISSGCFPPQKATMGIILSCNCRSNALFFFPTPPHHPSPSRPDILLLEFSSEVEGSLVADLCWKAPWVFLHVASYHSLIWPRVLLGMTGSFFFYDCVLIHVQCLTLTENLFQVEKVHPCFINISNNYANQSEPVKKTFTFRGTAVFDVEGELFDQLHWQTDLRQGPRHLYDWPVAKPHKWEYFGLRNVNP